MNLGPRPATPDASATRSWPSLPGWWASWAGLWHMTWRSVWCTRRWPVLGLFILASPVLAWLAQRTGELDPRPLWIHWISRVHFGLVVPLWCLIAFGSYVRDEVQAGTIGFLLTRPLTRARFVLVRWACTLMVVQTPLALATILLGLTGVALRIPGTLTFTALLVCAQLVVVPAYGAIAAFLGLLTRKYLLLGLVYGFIVEIGIGQIPTNLNTLSVTRHLQTMLDNFDALVQSAPWSVRAVGGSIACLVILTLVYLTAATVLFHFREYSQSEEHKL